jgi:hypothetical protein
MHRMVFSQPAIGKLRDVYHLQAAVDPSEFVHDLASRICGAIIHSDDFKFYTCRIQQRRQSVFGSALLRCERAQ